MSMILRLLLVSLSAGLISNGSKAGPMETGPGPTGSQVVQQFRKADSLLVTELPILARRWTDKCLIEERTGGEQALDCWRQAAAALGPYLKDFRGPLIDQAGQLQLTWLRRVEDLQSYQHAAAAQSTRAVVRPATDPVQSSRSEPAGRDCDVLFAETRRQPDMPRCSR